MTTNNSIINVNQIKIGSVIESRGMKMTVTKINKYGFVGFWTARNGDKVEISLPLSVIGNPHYLIRPA